jgi:hypothetical protein
MERETPHSISGFPIEMISARLEVLDRYHI